MRLILIFVVWKPVSVLRKSASTVHFGTVLLFDSGVLRFFITVFLVSVKNRP